MKQGQRRPQQQRAFHGLVGMPYGGENTRIIIDSAPPPRKIGRPTKGAVAMTAAQRQQRRRSNAEIDALIREQAVDRATGGAYGPGRFMKNADQGKGELVSGGYGSTELDAVHAKHNPGWDGEKSTFELPSRPRGAGPDDEAPGESVAYFGGRYTAEFNHLWSLQQKGKEWERICELLMPETTVCLLCDCVIGANPIATDEETYQHIRTHSGVRHLMECGPIIVDEPRCIVCGRPGAEHILASELTIKDREHNKNCTLEIFKQAGIQPRKMSDLDKAHRRAIKTARGSVSFVT